MSRVSSQSDIRGEVEVNRTGSEMKFVFIEIFPLSVIKKELFMYFRIKIACGLGCIFSW